MTCPDKKYKPRVPVKTDHGWVWPRLPGAYDPDKARYNFVDDAPKERRVSLREFGLETDK